MTGVLVAVDGPVARVLIDRPEARNALSPDVLRGLNDAIDTAIEQRCSVLVLRGTGGTLSAGADLKHLRTLLADAAATRAYITAIGKTLDRLESAPFVSVCVVEGYALAGGCEIVLACDLAIASARARIGDRHLEYGLLPGAGGSVRLSRGLPPALARRLLYTGEMISGTEAFAWGLVGAVAEPAELESAVDGLLARLARHAPDALRAQKRLHRTALTAEPAAAIDAEREVLLAHLDGPVVAEGLAAFAERRAPDFTAPEMNTQEGTG